MNLPCRFTFAATSLAVALSLPLAACGAGEPEPDAVFSSASEDLRRRAIFVGLGLTAAEAYLTVLQGEWHAEETEQTSGVECPARTYVARTLTLAGGGCVTPDGYRYDGRVVAHNSLTARDLFSDNPSNDPTAPSHFTFEDFAVASPDTTVRFDGRFEQSSQVGPRATLASELSVTRDGVGSYERLAMSCTTDGGGRTCTITRGDASIDGLGTFLIRGTFDVSGERPRGTLELVGAERLHVDLDAFAAGCAPITIDGRAAGALCGSGGDDDGDVPPPDPSLFLGYSASCDGTTLELEAFLGRAVDSVSVDVRIRGTDARTTIALDAPAGPGSGGEYAWTGRVAIAGSGLSCGHELELRVVATEAGARRCEVYGDASSFPAACRPL